MFPDLTSSLGDTNPAPQETGIARMLMAPLHVIPGTARVQPERGGGRCSTGPDGTYTPLKTLLFQGSKAPEKRS